MSEERSVRPLEPREGHEKRLQAILDRRSGDGSETIAADRKITGKSVPELAERRAKRLGLSVGELVERDLERLRSSTYPGNECLEHHEIELARADLLDDRRREHAQGCSRCKALLAALTPPENGLEEILEEVRSVVAESALVQGEDEVVEGRRRPAASPFVWDAVAATMPLAAGIVLVVGAAGSGFDMNLAIPVGLLVVVMACGLAVLLAKAGRLARFFRNSGGALAGGLVGAVVVSALGLSVHKLQQEATSTLLSLAEAELVDTAVTSFTRKLTTGKFAASATLSGPFSVTSEINQRYATYEAKAGGLAGVLEARLEGNGGALYFNPDHRLWTFAREPVKRAQLLVGNVAQSDGTEIVLEAPGGLRHSYMVPTDQPVPEVGHDVLVVLEPTGHLVTGLYNLSAERTDGQAH